jgi:signal transduction histidine kinase
VTVLNTVSERIAIHADRSRMQQVFLNLVRNAVEAQPGGGEVLLAARWLREPREVEIRIEDRGGGITPEQLPRIFDPFFTTKEAGRGIGLGLFVVHEIVSEHGGTIVADSTPGQGTAFTIRLPELAPEREKVQ